MTYTCLKFKENTENLRKEINVLVDSLPPRSRIWNKVSQTVEMVSPCEWGIC